MIHQKRSGSQAGSLQSYFQFVQWHAASRPVFTSHRQCSRVVGWVFGFWACGPEPAQRHMTATRLQKMVRYCVVFMGARFVLAGSGSCSSEASPPAVVTFGKVWVYFGKPPRGEYCFAK